MSSCTYTDGTQAAVHNLVRRKRETASTDSLPRAGGPSPRLDQPACGRVRHLVAERNDLTLAELCQQLEQEQHQSVSVSTLCRLVQLLGWPRKIKTLHASERDTPRSLIVATWSTEMKTAVYAAMESALNCLRATNPRQLIRYSSRRMANHDDIWRHSLQVSGRVIECFPPHDAAGWSRNVDGVCPQT
jgi:transposase